MPSHCRILLSCVLLAALAGCTPLPTLIALTPTSVSLVPSATRIRLPPTWTSTPSPTASPIPTDTPAPSLTPIPPPLDAQAVLDDVLLVYVQDGKIWRRQAGVTTLLADPQVPVGSPKLSEDGQLTAYINYSEAWEIYVVNTQGGEPRILVPAEFFASLVDPVNRYPIYLNSFGWLPDTHLLVFNTKPDMGMGSYFSDDMHVVDADSGEIRTYAAAGQGGSFALGPDGEHIALVSPTAIRVVNLDGSNLRTLFEFPMVALHTETVLYPQVVWAPDGQSLFAIIPPPDPIEKPDPAAVWRIPLEGEPVKTTELPLGWGNGRWRMDSITPGSEQVVFMTYNSRPGTYTMHLAGIDGSDDNAFYQFASNQMLSFLGWLPTGEALLFGLNQGIWIYHPGKEPELFVNQDGNLWFTISWYDERQFLYLTLSEQYPIFHLCVGSLDQEPVVVIENVSSYSFVKLGK